MRSAGDMEAVEIVPPLPSAAFKSVKVLLASNSPRRRQLLQMILPSFEIADNIDVDESYPADIKPEDVPAYIAVAKAKAHDNLLEDNELMITADTVVILDGRIYGKPHSREEAVDMLGRLSGRTHHVVTGVALSAKGHERDVFSETTAVRFAELSKAQIEDYVDRYRPFDKAGAYGVQEWVGAVGISGLDGCYYNVMGLPLHTLYEHLARFYQST